MDYKSNTQEMLARLARIKATIETGAFSDALVAGLNAGMGAMKRRIFNLSLDALGGSLGPYISDPYARKRRRAGRQTSNKDLEFHGVVRRAIEVVSVGNTKAEIRITDSGSADIARWQEQQVFNIRSGLPAGQASGGRVPIFELSISEQELVRTVTQELIAQKFEF